MKLLKKLSPTRLFRSRSISRSPSLSATSSSDASVAGGNTTPKSVLQSSDLIHVFNKMDRDGNGKITRDELEVVFSRLVPEPLSEIEITAMLCDVDLDGDGCISLDELKLLGSAFERPACQSELLYAFEFFDADRDGRITAEDLYAGLAAVGDSCTPEECVRMISGVDANGDGFVCFEDFARMMQQQK
ncbi:probable calcium-binding protein CML35 [Impatiens glandulifera]|uniref:probable calcium-binding protein CML35 n=1 Tax=Impatiens glandulifera TaxID=253017 RepID=UPI001FB0A854|nr:probable calcium-binding protein CML35 [Impatiens glandulifera]